MKVGRPFKPAGKRLDNLNNLIQTKYPQDKWVLEPILPIFLSIIDSSSTIEQQEQVIDLLNKVFNDYEFRYNIILENTIIMSKEFKRMQELAGLPITENKVEETKETINENFVGMGMVGNIFDREKTDYELAFEHFTKGTSLNEIEDDEEEKLTYNDFVQMVRDDMMAGAAPDERPSDEKVRERAKVYYKEYLQGTNVDDLFEYKSKEEVEEARVNPNNSDRVSYLESALDHVWNMGKGNNTIDFEDLAQSIVNDMFGDLEEGKEPLKEIDYKSLADVDRETSINSLKTNLYYYGYAPMALQYSDDKDDSYILDDLKRIMKKEMEKRGYTE